MNAQQLMPAPKGCKVDFKLSDGQTMVRGSMNDLKGTIVFDPADLKKASFDVTVNPGSVHTGDKARDAGLSNEPYFNKLRYPVIRIRSDSVTTDKPGSIVYTLHGHLTMKGVTRPVNIQFMATPMGTGYVFRGSLQLSRLAYNVGEKGAIDDNVSVFLEVRANRK